MPNHSPIDDLRAAAAEPVVADSPEYGLGTRTLPVSGNDAAPLSVRTLGENNAGGLLSRRISELEAERDYLRKAYDSAVERIAELEKARTHE